MTETKTIKSKIIEVAKNRNYDLHEYLDYLSSPWRILWTNFLAGLAKGLGFVIGATVLLALIVYVLGSVLAEVPIVGEFFSWAATSLESVIQTQTTGH